jgi:light-harvesting complex 1 alpha chain
MHRIWLAFDPRRVMVALTGFLAVLALLIHFILLSSNRFSWIENGTLPGIAGAGGCLVPGCRRRDGAAAGGPVSRLRVGGAGMGSGCVPSPPPKPRIEKRREGAKREERRMKGREAGRASDLAFDSQLPARNCSWQFL